MFVSKFRPIKRSDTANFNSFYKRGLSKIEDEPKPVGWEKAKPFSSIPGPKPLPLVGNWHRFMPGGTFYNLNVLGFHKKVRELYGPLVRLEGIPGALSSMCMTYDPSDIEKLFRVEGTKPERIFAGSLRYYRLKVRDDMFKGVIGLLPSSGEEWHKIRTIVNPILMQTKTLLPYVQIMDEIGEDLVKHVKFLMAKNKEMPKDFANVFNKWAFESIAAVALDEKLGTLDPNLPENSMQNQYIVSILELFEMMYQLDVKPSLWKYFSTKNWRRYVQLWDQLTDIQMVYIDKAMDKIKNNPTKNEEDMSVLERLVKINKRVALAMTMDMLAGGVDTTGKTIAASIYFLACNPQKQELLRKEAISLLPSKNSPITREILENAPYLKAVIKETNRMSPIGTGTVRKTMQDTIMSGYRIPKGTQVTTSQLLICNSEEFVDKAKEFIPERFLRDEKYTDISFKKVHPFAYMPFGFGPRICIGKKIVSIELEIALLKFARNFKMSWPHGPIEFDSRLVHGISGPLKVHLEHVEN